MARMRKALILLAVLASLAFGGEALAAEVVLQDDQGRPLRFDIRAEGVDAEWYAVLLRAAPHGEEIATVRVDVVSREELRTVCGREASGCYSRRVITVPAEQTNDNAHTVVHEYGHHLDRSTPVEGVGEPNGTRVWWRARAIAELVRLGSVARDYSLGWDRSIAEIFAEDYAQLALPGVPFAIRWLGAPDATVLAALKADLGLGPEPALSDRPPALKPVTINRSGSLRPKRSAKVDFGLLGPGRRVLATATLTGPAEKGTRATFEIRCSGERVGLKMIGSGKTTVTIDLRGLGPAECTATLTSVSRTVRAYALSVRLSVSTA